MIDIDYFKPINDGFGHQIGDEMIVHLAGLARECGVQARIGGEEFARLTVERATGGASRGLSRLARTLDGRVPPARSLAGA
ncbi:MAG: diguanylate cyclase [Rhodopseudomonas sp.]|uniref:diguanylate cyclase n=1 Tax=Rhodopseudomonas sp. TaxID=1078 RepID=UPI0039E6BAF2